MPISVGRIGLSDRWAAILAGAAEPFSACLADETACRTDLQRRVRVAASIVASDPKAATRAVNRAVNAAIRYEVDAVAWGQDDYWATPGETLRRGAGDCEDFALVKLGALIAIGLSTDAMLLVVLKDTARGVGHAVLAMRTEEGYDILDNLTDAVRRDVDVPSYQPLYSLSVAGAFVHGRRRTAPVMQAAVPDVQPRLRGSLN